MLTSCGVKKINVKPEISKTFAPELNEISRAEIGITLVSKEKGPKYDAIEITKEFKTKVGYQLKTVERSKVFINDHNTKKYHLYSNPDEKTFGIAIPRNGENTLIYETNSDPNGIYTTRMGDNSIVFKPLKEKIEYIKTFVSVKQNDYDYFKQEFVYNGRVGDALKFIYREYIKDYVRPGFTQELQYDLSESKIIGFRGLRIEIINATNTTIIYKVTHYFDN